MSRSAGKKKSPQTPPRKRATRPAAREATVGPIAPPGPNGYAEREGRGAAPIIPIDSGGLMTFDRMVSRPLEWLIPDLVPRGQMVLCVGATDAGKSTFFSRLSAHVTGGDPWDGAARCPPGRVLIYSPEEEAEGELLDRARAAGCVLSRLHNGEQRCNGQPAERPWMPDHLTRLADKVRAVKATLVIIDPLTSYLAPGISTLDGQHVRSVLMPLQDMVRALGITLLFTLHYRKSTSGDSSNWVSGSKEWYNVPRFVLAFGKDPRREGRYVLAPGKVRRIARPASLAYEIVARDGAGYFNLLGASTASAQDLGCEVEDEVIRSQREIAREYLRDVLETEEVKAESIFARMRVIGVSDKTVERAKKDLGITCHLVGSPGDRHWMWARPEKWPE